MITWLLLLKISALAETPGKRISARHEKRRNVATSKLLTTAWSGSPQPLRLPPTPHIQIYDLQIIDGMFISLRNVLSHVLVHRVSSYHHPTSYSETLCRN